VTFSCTVRVIEVLWEGPLTLTEALALNAPDDRGVLQIYGSHPVFGDDALLCIDKAGDTPIGERVGRLEQWFGQLPTQPAIYVGRLGGGDTVDADGWHEQIKTAARLLTFYHSPPWNSDGVDAHGVREPVVVLNLGRRHRLSYEVSTIWNLTQWTPDSDEWRPYGQSKPEGA
jgi:hypothetical protein